MKKKNLCLALVLFLALIVVCGAILYADTMPTGNESVLGGSIVIKEICTKNDSIIADTAASKASDMAEVGVTMHAWEYRLKWYGEDEKTARERAQGLGAVTSGVVSAQVPEGASLA